VEEVRQHRFDRIVEIAIRDRGRLVIELFSRGNVIWLDDKGVILVILESQEWRDRTLKPKLEYRYPPETPDINDVSLTEFTTIMSDKKEIVKIIATNLGLGAAYANEALERAGIDPEALPDKASVGKSYTTIRKMLDSKIDARIVLDEKPIDAVPFRMVSYKDCDERKKPSFNEAVDEYFTKLRDEGQKKESTKDYSDEVKRLERVIEKQEKTVKEMSGAAEDFKSMGDFSLSLSASSAPSSLDLAFLDLS
jgi:predicted ribosome quality control (RQC) complex YloA/Tae2 family protein